MPITRTAIQDDSGSGQDGTVIDNAWKQELYNQIDALVAGAVAPVAGTWTPIDGSGAGLTFTGTGARYWKLDKLVVIQAHIVYPATANGANALIAGLPFPNGPVYGGLYCPNAQHGFQLSPADGSIAMINVVNSTPRTNAQMTGASIIVAGSYLIA